MKLLDNYVSGRFQYVGCDYEQSETPSISSGISQGSVLEPLLFIMYMNDLCNVNELLFTVWYTDDTSVILNGKSLNRILKPLMLNYN